jgi:hypothetical protein
LLAVTAPKKRKIEESASALFFVIESLPKAAAIEKVRFPPIARVTVIDRKKEAINHGSIILLLRYHVQGGVTV